MRLFRLLAAGYAVLVVLALPAGLHADEPAAGAGAAPATDALELGAPATEDGASGIPGAEPVIPAPDDGEEPAARGEPDPDPESEPEATRNQAGLMLGPPVKEAAEPPSSFTAVDDAGPVAAIAAETGVRIKDFEFTPKTIEVRVGDTVRWRNEGPSAHSATATDGEFDTGILSDGESASHTFDNPGTYAYICTPHPFMKATVKVTGSSSGASTGDGTSSGSGAGGADPVGGDSPDTGAVGGDTAADDTFTDPGSSSIDDTAVGGDDSTLASTGFQVGMVGLLGLLLLAAGVFLRRREARGA